MQVVALHKRFRLPLLGGFLDGPARPTTYKVPRPLLEWEQIPYRLTLGWRSSGAAHADGAPVLVLETFEIAGAVAARSPRLGFVEKL